MVPRSRDNMRLPDHLLLSRHTPTYRTVRRWVLFCLVIALSLAPAAPALAADCPPASWARFSTPTHEDLKLLPGSDIDQFATAGDDGATIYAIGTWNSPCAHTTPVDPFGPGAGLFDSGQAPRLWLSHDGGLTWTDRTTALLEATNLPDAGSGQYDDFLVFTSVATAPDDANLVIVAGYNSDGLAVVAGSKDGAESFTAIGCGAVNGIILCAAVSPESDGTRDVALGTMDSVNGGRVWRCEVGRFWPQAWQDTGAYPGWSDAVSWDGDPTSILAVTSLSFSPSWQSDRTILAMVVAESEEPDGDSYQGYFLCAGRWSHAPAWNAAAAIEDYPVPVRNGGLVIHAPSPLPPFLLRDLTRIALPGDYDADHDARRGALLCVNGLLVDPSSDSVLTEGGFVFRVDGSKLSADLLAAEQNPWLASLAYRGGVDMRGQVLAGALCPATWSWSDIVAWCNGEAPALPCCSGVDIIVGEQLDGCCPQWTRATRPPSGQYRALVCWSPVAGAARAATSGGGRVWYNGKWYADESAFSGAVDPSAAWEQTGLVDTMIHRVVDLAFNPAQQTLYIHTTHATAPGRVCGCESVWRTTDAGASWVRPLHGRPGVSDDDEDAFDDIINGYYRGFYKPRTEGYLQAGGVRYLIGDAIDEDDSQQVQAGFEADAVYRLVDVRAGSWQKISDLVLNYEGLLHMDCPEGQGAVLYVGFDNLWWDYTANRPLAYEADGSDPSCPPGHDCRKVSGAARCLDPGRRDCCGEMEWDYLIRGLEGTHLSDGIYERLMLAGAHCSTDAVHLWAIDDGSRYYSAEGEDTESYDWCNAEFNNERWGRLWTYADCYAMTAVTTAGDETPRTIPSDPCRCAHEAFSLEWNRPCDACEYEVQIALDRDFTHIVLNTNELLRAPDAAWSTRFYRPFEPAMPDILVARGLLECGETYWWRVRAHLAETGEVISSWWSTPVRFHTAPGPPGQIVLSAPGDGATGVPVTNVGFTWTRVSGATGYDFMLVDRERGHVASQVGDFASFVLPLTLEHDTPYVWRVIALEGERIISESAPATFRTVAAAAPLPPPETTAPFTPPTPRTQTDWLPYFAGAIAALLALALAALSHVNRRLRRDRLNRRRGAAGLPPY